MRDKFKDNPTLYKRKAGVLKMLAHPQRLCILRGLCENEYAFVKDIQSCLNQEQAVVSQHLAKLREAGLIKAEREGTGMKYSIKDEQWKRYLSKIIDDVFL
ncbi:MAG: metalloregulator ArsR/SmtB family transcription factor [Peptostreptococcaceae bacterium]|nr:metalloregulator ArsR/SmtB family transcription factor [Peptostreptococcaceae bacterium]